MRHHGVWKLLLLNAVKNGGISGPGKIRLGRGRQGEFLSRSSVMAVKAHVQPKLGKERCTLY